MITMGVSFNRFAVFFCACGLLILVLWILSERSNTPNVPPVPGWDELVACADLVSVDGSKQMKLFENHFVRFFDGGATKDVGSGKWSYFVQSKEYSVARAGQSSNYFIVAPKGTDTCMLIKGSVEAADLRGSWFSSAVQDDADSRDDDHGAR
jgi:hypothetical protein